MPGNVELQFTLKDAQLIAGLLQQVRAIDKQADSIRKTTKEANAWEAQLKKTKAAFDGDAWNRQLEKTEAATKRAAEAAKRLATSFAEGKNELRSTAEIDSWARGMERIGTEAAKANLKIRELAQSARNAFISGQGGLSSAGNPDRWGAGMMQINSAAFAQAAQAKAAQMAGMGGLSVFPERDRWAAGMLNMGSQFAPRGLAAMSMHPLAGYGRPAMEAQQFQDALKGIAASAKDGNQSSRLFASRVDQATGSVMRFGAQLIGITSVAGAAMKALDVGRQALDFAQQQRQSGAETIRSDFEIMREISEVSGPGQAKGRYGKYLQLKQQLGPQAAWGLLEKAIATGNEGAVDYFAARQGAMNPALAMQVGSHLETLFKGQVNEIQGANMALEASRKSRWTVAQFAPSLPTAAVGGTMGGSSAAETLALQSIMSDVLASPEAAADRIQYAGVRGSQSPGLKSRGKGILAMMMEMHAMPFDSRHRTEFAGNRIEYNSFIDKVAENYDKIVQRTREIEAAQQRSMGAQSNLSVGQREFMRIPGAKESLEDFIATQQELESERAAYGTTQLRTQRAGRGIRRRSNIAGEGALARGTEARGVAFGEWLGGTPESATAGGIVGNIAGGGRFNPVNVLLQMLGLQAKTNELLKSIDAKAGSGGRAPAPNGGGKR